MGEALWVSHLGAPLPEFGAPLAGFGTALAEVGAMFPESCEPRSAGRYAAFGLAEQEAGEEVVDGDGGVEFGETGGEEGGEIGSVAAFRQGAVVLRAEIGGGVGDEHAAAAITSVLLAARWR